MVIDQEENEDVQFLQSALAQEVFGATTDKFAPVSFKFHYPSEHTVDGKRYDLEMHIDHVPLDEPEGSESDVEALRVVVFFSENEFDKSILQSQNNTIRTFIN